jgi:glutamate carboxypeptidase
MRDEREREVFATAVATLEALTAESSASGDRPGLERMASRLGAELARRGLDFRIRTRPGAAGDLPVLEASRGDSPRPLLLLGHFDTVLPAAAPRREGDRLYATGAIDMKGGFVALLGALDLLKARGVSPPSDLALLAVPDEEVGGVVSRAETRERGAAARAIWVLEPGEARADSETLVIGRRGLADWTLEARGRAAHSGLEFWGGRSAAVAAAEFATRAAALSEPGAGPTVNVARIVAGDAGLVDDLERSARLPRSGRLLNVVAERALVEGEFRFLTPRDRERTERALREIARDLAGRREVELEWLPGIAIPAVPPNGPGRALAERAVELARRRGWRLELEEERGGISFPNFLADPAAIAVLDGLGPAGGGMHTREEHVSLPSLERRILLLADLLEAEAGPPAHPSG